ncbi:restriction endonuclease subunit S [Campylobacter sp. RM12642]|uniref:restriction endonuclease subunit S n=1 Tax=unclassified Campylobacter TaxID=2593542 RepID=UPI001E0D232A|nr:restriction endonuclease subunit S [Campylobacter sp. RM12642]MBZ8007551.1 restriction endonuclease subunit S [Campylobacter sp. RM9334]
MTKLPNGWEVKKLKDLGIFIRGVSYKKEQLLNEKDENSVFLLRANNIQSQLNLDELQIVPKELAENKIIQDNDILFAMSSGSKHIVGKNIILKDLNDFSFGAFCGVFRATDESLNPYFLSYYFKSFEYHKYIQGVSKGSNINNLRFKDLEEFQITLPSLEEQRKIVKILDEKFASIDESIRLVKADLLSLDELWQSILNDSFNPLKSKLDNDTYTLPPTWKWEKLGDICEKTKNANLKDFNDDISYIDISSIDNKNFMILDYKKINSTQAPSRAKRQVKFGDILYATTRPNLKNIAMVNQEYYNPIASTGFCIIRAKKDVKKYIFYFLLSDYVTDFVARFIKGAQYPAVSDKDIFNIQIPLPPLKEQERIAKELESKAKTIKELKELYAKRLKDYEELKESLLDLAFKGGL